ncbi:MAG: hypothetical protein HY287_00780 [Planctomycetes bacterium]|nr:hypothetical protein [Planctomycetota bacterium]MBI3832843.1 hypothetical protein [Planctomycetota bacterium]
MRRRFMPQLMMIVVVIAIAGSLGVAGPKKRETRGLDTTVKGKLVDVHSFMTGKTQGDDPVRAAQDSFRAGAAAAVETPEGLVILGSGDKGPSRMIIPLALQQVEAKGKLYEKGGLKYLDMSAIQAMHGGAESPAKHGEGHEPTADEPTDGSEQQPNDDTTTDDESEEP